MRPLSIFALLALTSIGCATTRLTKSGKAVRLMKSDPPTACQEIGGVQAFGSAFTGDAAGDAKTKLRNEAAKQGADYVRMETATTNSGDHVTMSGTAYLCGNQ